VSGVTRKEHHRWRGSNPAEYSEDGSIGRPIANPGVELAFENTHLVPEHHDLDVLVRLRAPGQHDEAEDTTQAEVEERERHVG
jgi:hypothetical protein